MKVLTLGNGFVSNHLPYEKILDRLTIDQNQIRSILEKYKPDCLVNTIGFCGIPNIDQCEISKEKTIETNTIIPLILATECEKLNIKLIQIGSGCVFYGSSPHIQYFHHEGQNIKVDMGWEETDPANPQSYYSQSKCAFDIVAEQMKNVVVLRIRMPISGQNHPRNLINKLLNYEKVIDIPNSVSFMDDVVYCINWMTDKNYSGIFHIANPQSLTAVDILEEYRQYFPHNYSIISEKELEKLVIAKRSNCILNIDKLTKAGFRMRLAKEALRETMKEYVKNLKNGE